MTPAGIAEASGESARRADRNARSLGASPDHLAPGAMTFSVTVAETLSTCFAWGRHCEDRISNQRREQVAEFCDQSRFVRTARPADPA